MSKNLAGRSGSVRIYTAFAAEPAMAAIAIAKSTTVQTVVQGSMLSKDALQTLGQGGKAHDTLGLMRIRMLATTAIANDAIVGGRPQSSVRCILGNHTLLGKRRKGIERGAAHRAHSVMDSAGTACSATNVLGNGRQRTDTGSNHHGIACCTHTVSWTVGDWSRKASTCTATAHDTVTTTHAASTAETTFVTRRAAAAAVAIAFGAVEGFGRRHGPKRGSLGAPKHAFSRLLAQSCRC
jgi:hypothetical protein